MATPTMMPEGRQRYYNNDGTVCAGGKVYTYAAGTTNPKPTYSDANGTTANPNPVLLDAHGEAVIFWDGAYKVDVHQADGAQVSGYPVDNVRTDATGLLAQIGQILGAAGSSLMGFIQSGAGAIASTVQNELRRTYYTAQFDTPAHAVVAAAGKRLIVSADETVVLNVPSQFATPQAALLAMRHWVINGTAQVVIADGVYQLTGTLTPPNPFGANIQIIGNTASPNNVVFMGTNPPTFDLVVAGAGRTFGRISGVSASVPSKAALANNYTGFLALNGGVMVLDHCNSSNLYYGVAARNGGDIKYDTGTVTGAGDVGVWAFAGGNIQCNNVTSTATDVANGLGFGFQAEFGGVLTADNCSATGCNIAGFAALSNGTGRFYNCTSSANPGSGFMSRGGGQIEANGSSSTGNTRYGIEITEYGNIVQLATNTGNVMGAANPFPYFDTSTGQARLAASVGQLRLDTNDASSVFFNTSGGLQAEIMHMAAAVNRLALQGGAAGKAATLRANGTDAVIDVAILPKGNGSYVQFGAGYFGPAPAATGFFSVKLVDGTVVKVPCAL